MSLYIPKTTYILTLTILLSLFIRIGESSGGKKPDWTDGSSIFYPAEQYLTGVGMGESRNLAEDQAYAAISKIFTAKISSHTEDWERYMGVESKGQNRSSTEINIEQITKISTEKVIENVTISEVWFDPASKTYYALATMNRKQAASALMDKISALDSKVSQLISDTTGSGDKLKKIRGLGGTIRTLLLREALNTDLRVVDLSGKGVEERVSLVSVKKKLDEILRSDFNIIIEVTGPEAQRLAGSIFEGLNQKGFSLSEDNLKNRPSPDLIVRGETEISEVDLRDPVWKYVRWSANLKLIEGSDGKIFGSINKSGREGHLTLPEARSKAFMVMQNEITGEISSRIADYIFGTE